MQHETVPTFDFADRSNMIGYVAARCEMGDPPERYAAELESVGATLEDVRAYVL